MDKNMENDKVPAGQKPSSDKNKARKHLIGIKWLRLTLKTLFWFVVAILMIPILIYIPPIQNWAKNLTCAFLHDSTGMDIGIERFRLKFPVDVTLQGVTIIESSGDTMVSAREVVADVKLLPLIGLDVEINKLELTDAYYRMVSPDSSMIMKLRVGLLSVDSKSSADFKTNRINLNKALMRDGDIELFMDVWKQKPTPKDTTSAPFHIFADDVMLKNIRFAMGMLPTIDTLVFSAPAARLRKGVIDLEKNIITAKSLKASGGDVTYLTPTPEYISAHPAPEPVPEADPAPPMVVKADTVGLAGFKALYAVKDAVPLPGFDPSYIQVDNVGILLKDFYNEGSTVRLPLVSVRAAERSGLRIMEGHGTVGVNEEGLSLDSLFVKTVWSEFEASAGIPFALMEMKPDAPLKVNAKGHIGWPDIETFMPDLQPYTSKMPLRSPLDFDIFADGTLSNAEIPVFDANMDGVLSLSAKGYAQNALEIKKLKGEIVFDGSVFNPSVLDKVLELDGINLPTLQLKGKARANAGQYAADFALLTSAGDVTADGRVSMNSEDYRADVKVNKVDVAKFMPDLGVGEVTARLEASGRRFNPTSKGASTDIKLTVASLRYMKETLRDITADITLNDGGFKLKAVSANPGARLDIEGTGTVAPDLYTFDVTGRIDNLDLEALGLSTEYNGGSLGLQLAGTASPSKWEYDANLKVSDLKWTVGNQYFSFPNPLTIGFRSTPVSVEAGLNSRLTDVAFESQTGLKQLLESFSAVGDSLTRQMAARNVHIEGIQKLLPPFRLSANMSGNGDVGRYLRTMGMSMDTVFGLITNDSLLNGRLETVNIGTKDMRADTISLSIKQRGQLLDYLLHMGNTPRNSLAEFADVDIKGYLGENRALVSLTQKNQQGKTGYRIGMTASLLDSVASLHFTPLDATIAYMPWTFNDDNHVDYNLHTRHVDADLTAFSKESSIKLQTVPTDKGYDELLLGIKNLKIQDFLNMSVFAPPVTASVNADLKVGYTPGLLYGTGGLSVSDFTYDKMRVGDFKLKLGAGMNKDGTAGARVTLQIDGKDALSAYAKLVPDSVTKVLNPDGVGLQLTRFPLYIANPFLGADIARVAGYLNGDMAMSGTISEPLLTGHLECDSVGVFIPMLGSNLRFDNDSITVADNVLSFKGFNVWGANRNPLSLNGQVDASRLSDPVFNLNLNARNFQLIGNTKKSGGDIYGKLFLDMQGSATGPIQHFNVNADVKILNTTDLTYTVSSAQTQQITQTNAGDIVKFVNFNDTTPALKDSTANTVSMRIVANLNIEPGTGVEVVIPGGDVKLSPSGNLSYFKNYMGDTRLNGELFTGNGFVKYSLQVVSVDFTLNPESYVRFSGDMMNPQLNLSANQMKRVNIVQNGNSQLVDFNVGLDVTNTLSSPKVLFNLSTDDDMSIQNDLMSMSADQRSMAAINLLLTGQYTGQGVKTASSDLLQGTMYSMLTSTLNSYLANHIKGVDLSFGVDQYNTTTNGQKGSSTSYSYQLSKSLFNNKFKISVGGNYTTDASADENFSENLISDISFEYMLKQTSNVTMYARLFRHTGYESILEGEITETGVGFVLKRRLANLRNLFNLGNPFRRERKRESKEAADSTSNRASHDE